LKVGSGMIASCEDPVRSLEAFLRKTTSTNVSLSHDSHLMAVV
jgi:hypothetical protein